MDAFTIIRADTCPHCGAERSVDFFDKNNNPTRLTYILDNNLLSRLDEKELSYARCRRCKMEFMLNWIVDRTYPYPADIFDLDEFMRNYRKEGKNY